MPRRRAHQYLGPAGCLACGPSAAGVCRAPRGLCWECFRYLESRDALDGFPMLVRRGPELVEEANLLRARYGAPEGHPAGRPGGWSWARIAEHLGVSAAALDKARWRLGYPDPADPAGRRWASSAPRRAAA